MIRLYFPILLDFLRTTKNKSWLLVLNLGSIALSAKSLLPNGKTCAENNQNEYINW